jgi:hypothetical protein
MVTMVDGDESHFFGTINHGAVEYERWDYRMNSVKAAVERLEALDILCTASTATPRTAWSENFARHCEGREPLARTQLGSETKVLRQETMRRRVIFGQLRAETEKDSAVCSQ